MKDWKDLSKKGKIVTICLTSVLPLVLGVGAGIVISKFFLGQKGADISNINTSDISLSGESLKALMSKYETLKSNNADFSTELKSYEAVNIAYSLYSSHENSQATTTGDIKASVVNQTLRGRTTKIGNNFFEESISKSNIVAVATRCYIDSNDFMKFYSGKANDSTTASWPSEYTEYTLNQYADDFGKTPKTPLIYIVSKKTIVSGTESISKTDNGYMVKLSLSPTKGGLVNYQKQMKNISNLRDYPSFTYCNLSFEMDKDLLIKSLYIEESYYAKVQSGVGSDSKATLRITYLVDGDYVIPTTKENCIY